MILVYHVIPTTQAEVTLLNGDEEMMVGRISVEAEVAVAAAIRDIFPGSQVGVAIDMPARVETDTIVEVAAKIGMTVNGDISDQKACFSPGGDGP